MSSDQPIRLILNGRAANDAGLAEAIRELRDQGHDIAASEIGHAGHAIDLARDLPHGQSMLVIAAGGDGTLNEVVQGLDLGEHLDEISFGVLPFGTANDFAAHLDWLDPTPAELLKRLARGEDAPMDLALAGEHRFINAASAGAGAQATTEAPDELKGALGKLAYFISGVMRAGQLEGKKLHITGDEFEWSGESLGFVVANGRCAGGNVCIAPEARVDDGQLDLVVFPELPVQELMFIAAQYLLPPEQRQPCGVIEARAPWFRVESDSPIQCNLDGEPIELENELFELRPKAIELRLPA